MGKSLKEIQFDTWIYGWRAGSSSSPYDDVLYIHLEDQHSKDVAEEYKTGWEDGVRARNKAFAAAQERIGYDLSEGYERIKREYLGDLSTVKNGSS